MQVAGKDGKTELLESMKKTEDQRHWTLALKNLSSREERHGSSVF